MPRRARSAASASRGSCSSSLSGRMPGRACSAGPRSSCSSSRSPSRRAWCWCGPPGDLAVPLDAVLASRSSPSSCCARRASSGRSTSGAIRARRAAPSSLASVAGVFIAHHAHLARDPARARHGPALAARPLAGVRALHRGLRRRTRSARSGCSRAGRACRPTTSGAQRRCCAAGRSRASSATATCSRSSCCSALIVFAIEWVEKTRRPVSSGRLDRGRPARARAHPLGDRADGDRGGRLRAGDRPADPAGAGARSAWSSTRSASSASSRWRSSASISPTAFFPLLGQERRPDRPARHLAHRRSTSRGSIRWPAGAGSATGRPGSNPSRASIVIDGTVYLQAHNAWVDIFLQLGVVGAVRLRLPDRGDDRAVVVDGGRPAEPRSWACRRPTRPSRCCRCCC